ncbi:lymphoid-restricted membrane protein isoform X3 [Orussus abietinus]|uniref:lymphoid-restricted membrane protein isoform X3 n=1 Tax=Orussus abietinus TaxID=222816 RepID=UPI000C715E14|nr:lymphoid-restricted membrane protein isoform X3 [Orussus abietinus]
MCERPEEEDAQDVLLRKIFLECESLISPSTSLSTVSGNSLERIGQVPVTDLMDYIREAVNTQDRCDILDDLRNALMEVSLNGHVMWPQFREAALHWVARITQSHHQDGNNNIEFDKEAYKESDSVIDTVHGIDRESEGGHEMAQVELKLRVRQFDEENTMLRQEVLYTEESNNKLRNQIEILRHKFDQAMEKCKQLEKENDEQKDQLSELVKKEKLCKLELRKTEKEKLMLANKLEAMEVEKQKTSNLVSRLESVTKEKSDITKRIIEYRTRLQLQQSECELLAERVESLQKINAELHQLNESNTRRLEDEKRDLKTHLELKTKCCSDCISDQFSPSSLKGFPFTSPETPDRTCDILPNDSLWAELQASGFNSSEKSSRVHELEEEVLWYCEEIREAVKDLENVAGKLVNFLPKSKSRVPPLELEALGNPKAAKSLTETLRQKIQTLLQMVTKMSCKPETEDFSCQAKAEPATTRDTLREFNVVSFEDHLALLEGKKRKGDTNEIPIDSLSVFSLTSSFSKRDVESQSPFLSVTWEQGIEERSIIEPIVAAIDDIIDDANTRETWTQKPNLGSSTCRSRYSHTLPRSESPTEGRSVKDLGTSSTGDGPITPEKMNGAPIKNELCEAERNTPTGNGEEDLVESLTENEGETPSGNEKIERHRQDVNISGDWPSPPPLVGTSHSDTPAGIRKSCECSPRSFPRRKFSVFRRAFDEETSNGSILSAKDLEDDIVDAKNELRTTYRSLLDDSESSGGRSDPSVSEEESQQNFEPIATSTATCHPFVLAPGKLSNCLAQNCSSTPKTGNFRHSVSLARMADGNEKENNGSFPEICSDEDSFNGEASLETFTPVTSWPRNQKNVKKLNMNETSSGANVALEEQNARRVGDEERPTAFPSLIDDRLESEPSVTDHCDYSDFEDSLTVEELERKYLALSMSLSADRATLPKRLMLARRQRDQAEENLTSELEKARKDLQELGPRCVEGRLVEGRLVEALDRARRQLGRIARCSHGVSRTAETLGAVHQEDRVSRASSIADKYLRIIRARCERLAEELKESKRVLRENDILGVGENSRGPIAADALGGRYRTWTSDNRGMIVRRRASVATVSRSPGTLQDIVKEGAMQRKSVCGRIITRQPSFTFEIQKWETFALDGTNIVREPLGTETASELLSRNPEDGPDSLRERSNDADSGEEVDETRAVSTDALALALALPSMDLTASRKSGSKNCLENSMPPRMQTVCAKWCPIFWCILIFLIGFYAKNIVSLSSVCSESPWNFRSIEEILEKYVYVRNAGSRPI